jgi:hypothetical protein
MGHLLFWRKDVPLVRFSYSAIATISQMLKCNFAYAQGRSLHFGGPMRAKILAAPIPPNGGRQLCRLQFAKRVSVTQISDNINKQKHLSEIGESVAD